MLNIALPAEVVRWHRKAAEQGHAEAQAKLGFMYADGVGVSEDDAPAATCTAARWVHVYRDGCPTQAAPNQGWGEFLFLTMLQYGSGCLPWLDIRCQFHQIGLGET